MLRGFAQRRRLPASLLLVVLAVAVVGQFCAVALDLVVPPRAATWAGALDEQRAPDECVTACGFRSSVAATGRAALAADPPPFVPLAITVALPLAAGEAWGTALLAPPARPRTAPLFLLHRSLRI